MEWGTQKASGVESVLPSVAHPHPLSPTGSSEPLATLALSNL